MRLVAQAIARLTRSKPKVPAGPLLLAGLVVPAAGFAYLFRRRAGFRRWVLDRDPRRMTLLQTFRVFGFVFLVAWRRGVLPGAHAIPTAVSDMSIGLTAPFAAFYLTKPAAFRSWHRLGLSFLVMAVGLGALTSPPFRRPGDGSTSQPMAVFPFILVPTFLGPAVLLAHLAALAQADFRNQG